MLAAILAASGRADSQQDTTPIFVCGEDEKIPPIPFHWTNVVLAGDGRLYSPCPGGNHDPAHRELREAAAIGAGRYSADGDRRWRAVQAIARNSLRPQPPASALMSLPVEASIQLEEGTVILRLLPDVAPVTVARFAALVTQGYYNGLTFHRIVPNFVIQGGSPGANDYAGARRFMRDEIGPQGVHVRGAVGLSTRGTDSGDGQFFIDLVDLPHLDRTYTVFAYVTQGMDYVDRLLEGGRIVRVSVK